MCRDVPCLLLCMALSCGSLGCAPKLLGPTTPSGYRYTLSVSDLYLWINAPGTRPRSTAVIVRVQNAQGQPVDGVPVEFQVAPSWVENASLTPQRAVTHDGSARAIFVPQTTGAVHLTARVENIAHETTIVVQSYSPPQGR
jgi:hypothetical protein